MLVNQLRYLRIRRGLEGVRSARLIYTSSRYLNQRNLRDEIENSTSSSTKSTVQPKEGNQEKVKKKKISNEKVKEEILEVINTNKGKFENYVDFENLELDLSKSNKELVDLITKNANTRMEHRFKQPNDIWLRQLKDICSKIPMSKFMKKGPIHQKIDSEVYYAFQNGTVSSKNYGSPLGIGDLVILTEGSTEFYIVVGIPKSISKETYTYINAKGKIVFGPKSKIKFRIPSIIPKKYNSVLEHLVMVESKISGMSPIGISDIELSRSSQAKPNEINKKYQKEVTEDSKPVKVNEKDLPTVPLESHEDDLLLAHASPSLLKDTDINTYIVPPSSRQIYSKPLTRLSIQSMDLYKEISGVLEILHRLLQYNEHGDIITTTRSISIFQILHILQNFEFGKVDETSEVKWKNQILEMYGTEKQTIDKLGKFLSDATSQQGMEESELSSYPIHFYFATILAIRKQSKLWKIVEKDSINPVNSIIILPMQEIVSRDELTQYLKLDGKIMVDYIIGKINKTPVKLNNIQQRYYQGTIKLFQDYVIGNLDPFLVSKVTGLIREIDNIVKLEGDYAFDYGKSKCLGILKLLGEDNDPVLWSILLDTEKLKQENNYFNHLKCIWDQGLMNSEKSSDNIDFSTFSDDLKDPIMTNHDFYNTDPMKHHRKAFHHPIFCIDSADAHEIDDGISIIENESTFTIGVHIANPSSFIKPFSTTSQIAYRRGVTTYLPTGPLRMVPEYISEISGLVGDSTKTFTIEFDIPKDFKGIQNSIDKSKRIKFYTASNLPKGYTYNRVNEILAGDKDQYSQELTQLYKISKIFNKLRLDQGGIEIKRVNQVLKVNKTDELDGFNVLDDNKGYEIIDNGSKISLLNETSTASTTLVSEFMIMGNHVTSLLATSLNIPVIYRNQSLNVTPAMIKSMKQAKNYQEILDVFKNSTAAQLSIYKSGHKMLGLNGYCQITSPLRRYSDLINQWNFQNYYLNHSSIQVSGVINHLQSRELINRQIGLFSERYWSGKFLTKYQELVNNKTINDVDLIKFNLFIKKFVGDKYKTDLIGFKLNTFLKGKLNNNDIGKILKDYLVFEKIDYLDNEVIVKQTNLRDNLY